VSTLTRTVSERADGPDAVVAIPVRNESERIEACLRALDSQVAVAPGSLGLVLFLNNCTDGTEAIVDRLVPDLAIPVRVMVENFHGAHAGWARRRAMDAAAAWLGAAGPSAMILSTDADSRVPPDWVARNRAALDAGADAVAGRVELDEAEAALLPPSLPARGRLEDIYDGLITEAEARIDPDPHDPWPCHRTAIGATLAVTRTAYLQVGGMPEIPLGEDGAFIARLIEHGLRVRHATDVCVTISARLTGRAAGGVADTIRARCEEPDAFCDARMETFPRAVRRYLWRRRFRRLHGDGRLGRDFGWALAIGIDPAQGRRIAALPLGRAIAEAERASPHLAYRPIGPRQLPGQIRLARCGLAALRLGLAIAATVRSVGGAAPLPGRALEQPPGRRI
jgi:glycosyltransferase involved in cell wall biosynthesis